MREDLLDEINKRITLNLLIQGSAQHATNISHHLVGDDLDALDPRLKQLYERIAIAVDLAYWSWPILLIGNQTQFLKRASTPGHPLANHSFLVRHGVSLAAAGKRHAVNRSREKGISRVLLSFDFQSSLLFYRASVKERGHREQLVERRTRRDAWR